MALYAGTTKVVADDCALGFSHFEKPAGNVASTQVVVPAIGQLDANEYSGYSVAAGYGKIVVGTPQIEGPGSFDGDEGAIQIMDLDGSNKITVQASSSITNSDFGGSVAIHSKYVIVGCPVISTNQVYLYNHDGTGETILVGPEVDTAIYFGYSIAVVQNKLIVGAYGEDTGTTNSGSVYIYDLSAANIANSMIKISNPDPTLNGYFGKNVAGGCGRIVVAADGNPNGNGSGKGVAYVYNLHGNLIKKINTPTNETFSGFGLNSNTTAVGSGRILLGAPYQDRGNVYSAVGEVWMYDLDGNYIKTLESSEWSTSGYFGNAVSVNEGIIAVGETNGNTLASNAGAVHLFDLNGNLLEILPAANVDNDDYGYDIAIGSGRIVVGDPFYDELQTNQGAAYIYTFEQNFNTLIDQTGEGYA
jgi:hypothetical protein